jgi:hypothetical protein
MNADMVCVPSAKLPVSGIYLREKGELLTRGMLPGGKDSG